MKKILFTFFVFIMLTNLSYADNDKYLTTDKNKTIKELIINIEDLDRAKENLEEKIEKIEIELNLSWFLRPNLTEEEKSSMDLLFDKYNEDKNKLEKRLEQKAKKVEEIKSIKKELFDLRKNLYEGLLNYIDSKKYKDYVALINEQTNMYLEEIQLDSNITQKSEMVNEKLISIEWKIIEHRNYLNETMKTLVNEEIAEKIKIIKDWDAFNNMTKEEKLAFLDDVIYKFNELQKNLIYENNVIKVTENIKANNNKKVEMCILAVDRFTEFRKEVEVSDMKKSTTKMINIKK